MTKNFPTKIKKLFSIVLTILIIFSCLFSSNFFNQKARAVTITELNDQISQQKKEINALNDLVKHYQEQIKEKQKQEKNLENQIFIMKMEIQKTETEIQAKEKEITEKELQIEALEMKIEEKKRAIDHQKEILEALIRNLYETEQKSSLEIFLLSSSLSEYLDEIQYTKTLHQKTKEKLDEIKNLKKDLEWQKTEILSEKTILLTLKLELNVKKRDLENQKKGKENSLVLTKEEENKFKKLLALAQENYQAKQREIARLQEEVKKVLIRMQGQYKGDFIWPLQGRLTQGFGQTSYSKTGIYGRDENGNPKPHTGIDIANYDGAPIVSATDGEVIHAGCSLTSGCSKWGYGNYVSVLSNDLWITYGHMSLNKSLAVKKGDKIKKGTLLGYQGNTGFSSGSHLHFEIRKIINEKGDYQLVNPMNYLP